VTPYDGVPKPEVFDRLNALIAAGPFHVELGQTYELEDAARAHRDLSRHHLGKLALCGAGRFLTYHRCAHSDHW
jgi:NADPH:quinone reductase-like Zn-dependent oxidoreductase